jgi:hypothetical protein
MHRPWPRCLRKPDDYYSLAHRRQAGAGPLRRGRWSYSAASFPDPIVILRIDENGVRLNDSTL